MKASDLTSKLFKVNDKPLVIAPRYQDLFDAILTRKDPRVNVIAPTQDGKSLTIASAITLACTIQSERWIILAPSDKKADIIMSYIRDFATQNPIISSQLELDKNDTLDRLKRERSKRHLTFKRGGGVMTLTLDAKNSKRSTESAMGFGGKNIVADEAGLVNDFLWATVMRMLGGYSYNDSFLLKIGNPFFRNHFYRSSINPEYKQVRLNYKDSLKDREAGFHGFDPKFIEEMRQEAFFDVYYNCDFPQEDIIDADGYIGLIGREQINWGEVNPSGELYLGCDVGGGGDKSVIVLKGDNGAKIISENRSTNIMDNVVEIERVAKEYNVPWENVNIDDIGVGRGVSDRLKEKGYFVNGVNVGASSSQKEKFSNMRAELHWAMREYLLAGAVLDQEQMKQFEQVFWVRYKVNTDKVIKIIPKEDIKTRYSSSPDYSDALMLSMYKSKKFKMLFL